MKRRSYRVGTIQGMKMDTVLLLVGLWIRESKPAPIAYYPHDCIMELAGVCQKCEELIEWNYCVMEEWKNDYTSFFEICSAQVRAA